MIQLKTAPLGFEVILPTGDGQHALRAFIPLSVSAAQGLVLALIAQPAVGGELTEDLKANLSLAVSEHAQVQSSDAEFLRAAGVRCD
jgi:hypothetical protein